jgi:NAD-dependent dihydropyrimidine dehydrogenase PreA subunit
MTKIITDNCDGCGSCIDACAYGAITIENDKAVIDRDLCMGCGVCIGTCLNLAIIPNSMNTKSQDIELRLKPRPGYRPTNKSTYSQIQTLPNHQTPSRPHSQTLKLLPPPTPQPTQSLFFHHRNIPILNHFHYRLRKRRNRGRR